MPTLHPTRYKRPARHTWEPAGLETLTGWLNVRIWSYDRRLGVDLYVTDECPGVLHEENAWTETVLGWEDNNGDIANPDTGELYDPDPVVIDLQPATPAWKQQNVGPDWTAAITGGGYLGSCPADMVPDILRRHGFEDAIPKPADWVADNGDDL